MPRTPRSLAALLITVAALGGVSSCGDSEGQHPKASRPRAGVPSEDRAAQLPRLSPLRRSGDRVSHGMEVALQRAGVRVGSRVLLAFRAHTADGPIWLVRPGQRLCLLAGAPLAVSCAPFAVASRRGAFLGVVEHPAGPPSVREFVLYGVVPTPQRAVRLRSAHKRLWLAVKNGAFSFRSHEQFLVVVSGRASS